LARFGNEQRRADLAGFEAFRFAYLAGCTDEGVTSNERRALMSICHRFGPGSSDSQESYEALVGAVAAISLQVAELESHSLVLRMVRSNVSVREWVQTATLELIGAQLALGGVSNAEHDFLKENRAFLTSDRPVVDDALIVVPRARTGLRPDPVFDALFRVYEDAVPWRS
jgi:hypothetical protein